MSTKDVPLTAETPEAEQDVPLTAAAPEPADELQPEDFDLASWLDGIAPARAVYSLAGRDIELQARTADWREGWLEQAKELDQDVSDREFLAAHIVDEKVTPDTLKALQAGRPVDFADMVALAIHLDTRPTNTLAPRFLPKSSD